MTEAELLKRVGATIRLIRETLGWSQEVFAQVAGLDRAHYGRIERGAANISLKALFRLAAELETSPGNLVVAITEEDVRSLKRDGPDVRGDRTE